MIKMLFYKRRQFILLFTSVLLTAFSSRAQVSVTSTAGTTGPIAYTTVSGAFAAINAGTHQGAIDISITGNVAEPTAVTPLLKSAGTSSYTSVLIHPVGGNWAITSTTVTAGHRGTIELQGADNVTIDGDDPLTTGSRNLTIESARPPAGTSYSGASAIRLCSNSIIGTDGADNNTVKNCIIVGARNSLTSTTATYGIIMCNYSTTTSTTGAYSSINTVIENNEIKRVYTGIYARGSFGYVISGTVIKNNILGSSVLADNIGGVGIYVSYSSTSGSGAATIQNNDIRVGDITPAGSGSPYTARVMGIEVNVGNVGCLIQGNNIHDNGRFR